MFGQFIFQETSPSAPGTAASSQRVQNAGNIYPAGVAAPLDDFSGLEIVANLRGATGGLLDVYLQCGLADGTWVDVVHFAQLAAAAGPVVYKTGLANLAQPTTAVPTVVGTNLNPALAAPTTVQGQGFDRLRLLFVAGSGTTAGASITVRVAGQRPRLHD